MLRGATGFAQVVAIIYLTVFFALGSGLVNSIIEGRNFNTFIVPSRSVQTIAETVVMTLILFMGMGGVFLLYKAGRSLRPKSQQGFLAAGFGLLGVAMLAGYSLVNLKG